MLPFLALAQAPRRAAAPAPSLHEATAAAWALLPQRRDYAARRGAATARQTAAGAFFPNAPSFTGTHVNDRALGSNQGYITTQAELSTPIWLPGQGTATQGVARADMDAIEAEAEAAHLALAAQVLDLATQGALSVNARDVAARRLATSQALAGDVARRFRVGESAESDSLAAEAEAASARVTLIAADAQLLAARAALRSVTGEEAIPRLGPAGGPPPGDMLASHPRIVAGERAVEAARSAARLVGIENRDSPEIGLQGIDEKQPGTRWDTRAGVTFRFPFATEARNAPRRAAAEQAVTQAVVQLELARRDVLLGVRQAEVALAGALLSAGAAAKAAEQLDRRRGQIERAWRMGEMSLVEVVRANALAFDAAYARDKARTDLGAARERLALAQGVVP